MGYGRGVVDMDGAGEMDVVRNIGKWGGIMNRSRDINPVGG